MKARITTVVATAVVALAVAGGALAAPHQTTIRGWSHGPSGAKTWNVRGWDYTRPSASAGWTSYHPGTVKPWTVKTWQIKAWSVKPNPWASRGSIAPNPSGSRGSIAPNPTGARRVKPNPTMIRLVRPNPSSIRGEAVKGW
jgi:hypothetical protein